MEFVILSYVSTHVAIFTGIFSTKINEAGRKAVPVDNVTFATR